ncbi:hypothetical protein EHW64_04880 [Erwinia psidii]|nr:hypothetical protein [Erwinia psidii]
MGQVAPERLTDERGEVVWRGRFPTWGKTERETVNCFQSVPQNLRFQGQYLDRETGLHYNLFRYYDPLAGRYTQPDPPGLAGGLSTYAYAPNPLSWIDPFGLAKTGCGVIGEVKPRGLAQNRSLMELTHAEIVQTFKGSDIELSNHAIARLKDVRTKKPGFETPNDIASIFNKGNVFNTGRGDIGFSHNGLEAIVNPNANRIVTFRPAKSRF